MDLKSPGGASDDFGTLPRKERARLIATERKSADPYCLGNDQVIEVVFNPNGCILLRDFQK